MASLLLNLLLAYTIVHSMPYQLHASMARGFFFFVFWLGVLARVHAHLLLSRFACAYLASSKTVMCMLEATVNLWCLLDGRLAITPLNTLSKRFAVSACQWTDSLYVSADLWLGKCTLAGLWPDSVCCTGSMPIALVGMHWRSEDAFSILPGHVKHAIRAQSSA